jgi:hypothetical protein
MSCLKDVTVEPSGGTVFSKATSWYINHSKYSEQLSQLDADSTTKVWKHGWLFWQKAYLLIEEYLKDVLHNDYSEWCQSGDEVPQFLTEVYFGLSVSSCIVKDSDNVRRVFCRDCFRWIPFHVCYLPCEANPSFELVHRTDSECLRSCTVIKIGNWWCNIWNQVSDRAIIMPVVWVSAQTTLNKIWDIQCA